MTHKQILDEVSSMLSDLHEELGENPLGERIGSILWFIYDNTDGAECVMLDETDGAIGNG